MALTDGLIAGYHFNNDRTDFVGSNDLTGVGSTLDAINKKLGSHAMNYDAIDDRDYSTELISSLANHAQGTMAFWIRIQNDANLFKVPFMISREADATASEFMFGADLRSPFQDYLIIAARVDGGLKWYANTPLNSTDALIRNYALVIVDHDGVAPRMHINNVTQSLNFANQVDKTLWWKGFITDASSPADVVTWGCNNRGGVLGSFYDGQHDETIFWDRVLTSAERTELWNGGDGIEMEIEEEGIGGTPRSRIINFGGV